MSVEWQILAAFALDLALGDPAWRLHPARMIGRLAAWAEAVSRKYMGPMRVAGVATVIVVLVFTVFVTYALIHAFHAVNPALGDAVSIFILYTTFASRDLADHALAVYRSLEAGDLPSARARVGMMVGRDTDKLNECGTARACVESVAESLVDGVTAPLFFAALGGPVGAMAYRAANTLDSMFGYKNERYRRFGWASAKVDDVLNFIPARLTAPFAIVATVAMGMKTAEAARTLIRDGKAHPSPNSGLAEAVFAGALNVRLGGVSYYNGVESRKPFIGRFGKEPEKESVRSAVWLMLATSVMMALVLAIVRSSLS